MAVKTGKIQSTLGKLTTFFNRNIYIQAIKDGMLAYVPFTIITSVFLIIGSFPIPAVANWLASVFHLTPDQFAAKLGIVNDASLVIGGLIVLLAIAKNLAKQMKLDEMPVVLTTLVSFFILTPYQHDKSGNSLLNVSHIGAQAIFLAILVAILVAVIYRAIDRKGIKIKLPASVPPAVSKPFESIIPSFAVITVFWIIRLILDQFAGQSALDVINTVLGAPLKAVGGSLIGIVIAKTFSQFLWFFGIHGDSIVNGVMTPILQVLQDENKTASLAHHAVPNIVNQSFWDNFAGIGVIGAIIAIAIVAKSSRYRALKKVALVPYIFNIGEPTLFGVPLMLDFTYFIPLVFSNMASVVISYLAFATHFVPIPTGLVQVPWTTPVIVSGFLVTGSWQGAVLQFIDLIVVTLIWLPFVKIADKRNMEAEIKGESDGK
ncbi:PTS system cellobiose-specific IIC component [Lactobacillus colini]|uniref:Permease IIC component n=1 Tax=Lactobacillus colini TaxID=1819254 RepID=A0ABS4MET1_9LACO|nr:PTS transporter subunit EIIC [Lactobacillus colini]MBP2058192.1 PTS system cellobiose-specific IIC component [Lactobacillus colini]